MACSHVKNCELFVQFALNPALDIWKKNYCEGNFNSCARFEKSKSGRQIPLTLLPNGKLIEPDSNDEVCGSMAIFNAILKDRTRMVSSLIKVGVDINGRNIDGITPLMVAAEYGRTEICHLLLQHGADIDASNIYGQTALDIAEKKGHQAIVSLFSTRMERAALKIAT